MVLYFDENDQSLTTRYGNTNRNFQTIEQKSKNSMKNLKIKEALKHFLEAVKEENQLAAFFVLKVINEKFLRNVLYFFSGMPSLLFVACLYAPAEADAYLPNDEIHECFRGGLPTKTTFLGLVVWYIKDSLTGCIINALWLWPGVYFLYALYDMTENIEKTRLHEERLWARTAISNAWRLFTRRWQRGGNIGGTRHADSKAFLDDIIAAIQFRQNAVEHERRWQEHTQRINERALREAGGGYHEIENHYSSIVLQIERTSEQIKKLKTHLKHLKEGKTAATSVFGRHCNRWDEDERIARACLPAAVQTATARREAMILA